MKDLSAINLKDVLWTTLNELRDGDMSPGNADAIAAQSREILRTVNTQLRILSQSRKQVTSELVDFATSEK